jgi:competence/damage-inducible protein CinA C-terminal domain
MKAEIIPTGTEILLGNIADVNSAFLANQLSLLGIDLYFISAVGDNLGRMVNTLKQAWMRADLLITTGGLGPTQGDITREAIAELVGEELKVDPRLWQELQDFFKQHNREIPQSNMKQAMIIPSAKAIPNSMGTAPGWWVEKDNHMIVALPGPPDEMKLMWDEGVMPIFRQRLKEEITLSRTIKSFKVAEAKIDELLTPFLASSNPTLATYIKPDGVHLRITAKAKAEAEAKRMIAQREAEIRNILAPYIWGADEDTLESVIINLLKAENLSLATIESCTQGLLCHTIASSPESLASFKGGLVTCCDEGKMAFGVEPYVLKHYGSESSQVAEAMAEVVRRQFKADVGLSITGSADDSKKEGAIFVGLDGDNLKQVIPHTIRGNRPRVMQRAVYSALFDLRKTLLQEARCI